jgi:hypothetical protein
VDVASKAVPRLSPVRRVWKRVVFAKMAFFVRSSPERCCRPVVSRSNWTDDAIFSWSEH